MTTEFIVKTLYSDNHIETEASVYAWDISRAMHLVSQRGHDSGEEVSFIEGRWGITATVNRVTGSQIGTQK